jgi:hypothetical protein
MATGVLKVRVGGAWIPVATAAGGPHHATHETGGNDALVSLDAGILTSGTVPDARFPAVLPAVSGANLTNLNASNLTSGIVPDARLSTNVPLKNQQNIFTSGKNFFTANTNQLVFTETGAPAAAKVFDIAVYAQTFQIRALNDAASAIVSTPIIVQRNGDVGIQGNLTGAPNVLKVAGGFPGGTTTFLRADGIFAVAGTGDVVGPPASATGNVATYGNATGKLIQDSGVAVSNLPRLNQGNTFQGTQVSAVFSAQGPGAGGASFMLMQTDAAVGSKWWQFYNSNGILVCRNLADDWSAQYGYFTLDHVGNFGTSMDMIARGLVKIGAPDNSWPSLQFMNTYFTINNKDLAQIAWFHEQGIFQINAGNLRFASTLFSLQNSAGTPVLTVRSDGVVTIPYFLVVPVGVDKWAPA